LRIQEPAADLAAAAALVSSLVNAPLPTDAVFFGEISLSGAVRPVAQTSARLKEAAKLGFGRGRAARIGRGEVGSDAGMVLNTVGGLTGLVADIAARGSPRETGGKPGGHGGGEKCHTGAIPSREWLKRVTYRPSPLYNRRTAGRFSGLVG